MLRKIAACAGAAVLGCAVNFASDNQGKWQAWLALGFVVVVAGFLSWKFDSHRTHQHISVNGDLNEVDQNATSLSNSQEATIRGHGNIVRQSDS